MPAGESIVHHAYDEKGGREATNPLGPRVHTRECENTSVLQSTLDFVALRVPIDIVVRVLRGNKFEDLVAVAEWYRLNGASLPSGAAGLSVAVVVAVLVGAGACYNNRDSGLQQRDAAAPYSNLRMALLVVVSPHDNFYQLE